MSERSSSQVWSRPSRRHRKRWRRDTRQRRRVVTVTAGLLCGALVVGGIGALLTRPVAPDVVILTAPSQWFDEALLDRIGAYRRPLYWVLPVAALVGALGPLTIVLALRSRRRHRQRWESVSLGGVRSPSPMLRFAAQGMAVAVAVGLVQEGLLLPFRWWIGYRHAGNFGLRTQGFGSWLADLGIATGVGLIGLAVVVGVVVAAMVRWPGRWPLAVGLGVPTLLAATIIAWPIVVEPLRFDFVPLESGQVRTAVEAVRDDAGLRDVPILVADASRRTTRQNAYVSGFGATRRIVLYDTLVELPATEVAAVVAHEVAHDLHNDLLRGWLMTAAAVIVGSLALGGLIVARSASTRRLVADPWLIAVAVGIGLLAQSVLSPASSWVSRRVEASADATALELMPDPQAYVALQQSLVTANLSDPSPPGWWQWWRGTHPPPLERLERAAQARRPGTH